MTSTKNKKGRKSCTADRYRAIHDFFILHRFMVCLKSIIITQIGKLTHNVFIAAILLSLNLLTLQYFLFPFAIMCNRKMNLCTQCAHKKCHFIAASLLNHSRAHQILFFFISSLIASTTHKNTKLSVLMIY